MSNKRVSRLVVKIDFANLEIYIKSRKFSSSFLKKNIEEKKYIIVETKEEGLEVAKALLDDHAKKLKTLLSALKNPDDIKFVKVEVPEVINFKIDASKSA